MIKEQKCKECGHVLKKKIKTFKCQECKNTFEDQPCYLPRKRKRRVCKECFNTYKQNLRGTVGVSIKKPSWLDKYLK